MPITCLTHHVPLGLLLLLLKLGHLAVVADLIKQLPDENQGNAYGQNTADDYGHDDPRVDGCGAVWTMNSRKCVYVSHNMQYSDYHIHSIQ